LQGIAELDGVIAASRVAIPKNLNAHEPHGAGDPVAVEPQLLERLVARVSQIHFHAVDDLVQHGRRDGVFGEQTSDIASEIGLVGGASMQPPPPGC
jgi:hypothetical protein